MGLDMYLYAEKYISSHDYKNTPEGEYTRVDNPSAKAVDEESGLNVLPTGEYGGLTVKKCIAYWRKANSIHGWFVRELANGVDNCEEIYVERKDLMELREQCKQALKERALVPTQTIAENAEDVGAMPPVEGFFFGNYERDEWYYETLENTVKVLDEILSTVSTGDISYSYRASW